MNPVWSLAAEDSNEILFAKIFRVLKVMVQRSTATIQAISPLINWIFVSVPLLNININ